MRGIRIIEGEDVVAFVVEPIRGVGPGGIDSLVTVTQRPRDQRNTTLERGNRKEQDDARQKLSRAKKADCRSDRRRWKQHRARNSLRCLVLSPPPHCARKFAAGPSQRKQTKELPARSREI
jgi:hypothetical protein